jgi:hypothetical protein
MYTQEVAREGGLTGPQVRKHVRSGRALCQLSGAELEAKLGIGAPLHRKKVLLGLAGLQGGAGDPAGGLDHQWVIRWLEDLGLPQYKDAFLEARVDGRVLNFLTTEDLLQLKVTSQLHHLSIKRGIQVVTSLEGAAL